MSVCYQALGEDQRGGRGGSCGLEGGVSANKGVIQRGGHQAGDKKASYLELDHFEIIQQGGLSQGDWGMAIMNRLYGVSKQKLRPKGVRKRLGI